MIRIGRPLHTSTVLAQGVGSKQDTVSASVELDILAGEVNNKHVNNSVSEC